MKVKPYFPVPLTIDGEEVVLRIKRMTDDEFGWFAARYTKVATPTITRVVSRAPSGLEQERDEQGRYRLSFEQLCEQRLEAMAGEERDRFIALTAEDEKEARAFLREAFETFVTVERGLTEETLDGREVSITSGADLLRLFGARKDVLMTVLQAILNENTLDARQKKASSSPSASSTGSPALVKGRAGRRRATTAARAGTAASAAIGAATSTTPDASSGSTATSAPPGVPSVN